VVAVVVVVAVAVAVVVVVVVDHLNPAQTVLSVMQ
jgi:hypothetical protein